MLVFGPHVWSDVPAAGYLRGEVRPTPMTEGRVMAVIAKPGAAAPATDGAITIAKPKPAAGSPYLVGDGAAAAGNTFDAPIAEMSCIDRGGGGNDGGGGGRGDRRGQA